jgi:septum formation protein
VKIVLASGSPQRREILERLGLDFDVVVPEVEEVREGEPRDAVLENARRKAAAVEAGPDGFVIGCDTDVVVDGITLGKPKDEGQAREFLELLSGRSHEVLSGLVVLGPGAGQERSGVAASSVTFRELAAGDIDGYLRSGEWRGRAGGYAVQGLGSTLVERVEGDITNVIGLPLRLLHEIAPELSPGAR